MANWDKVHRQDRLIRHEQRVQRGDLPLTQSVYGYTRRGFDHQQEVEDRVARIQAARKASK
jgi:hypothetical protein